MGFLGLFSTEEEKSAQQASKDYKQQQKEQPKEEEREPKKKDKETQWADTNEDVKYVIHGGKVQCQYCSPPMADIIVTSNTVMLQDKPFVTVKDKDGKKNFNFTGVCNHPSQQKPMSPPPPCKSVIQLGEWKNYSETKINDDNALLVKSTIPCMISGEDLKIIDSGQKAELTDIFPWCSRSPMPMFLQVQWLDGNQMTATEYLVKAKAYIKLTTLGAIDGTDLLISIKTTDSEECLKFVSAKIANNTAQTEAITIEEDWENKTLTIEVNATVWSPTLIPTVKIKPQFRDPLDHMQIRRNEANNLFGKVRSSSTKNHQGFDYYASTGTDIKAVSNGKIDRIVDPASGDYGKQIVLKIDNSQYYAFYAHLSAISVAVGAAVQQGDVLGQSGCTGNAAGFTGEDQHLHFECRTISSPGLGLGGRENPNNIVITQFSSQDVSKIDQSKVGVKKVDADGEETLMNVIG